MSRTYIPVADRRLVRERASGYCEYCLIHEDDVDLRHEVDHIIAEKHGGATHIDNLAYACFLCNNNKGSDIASVSRSGVITRFFNPRTDSWVNHFRIDADTLVPESAIGEATERIFAFNTMSRVSERRGLQLLGRFPISNAMLLERTPHIP